MKEKYYLRDKRQSNEKEKSKTYRVITLFIQQQQMKSFFYAIPTIINNAMYKQ